MVYSPRPASRVSLQSMVFFNIKGRDQIKVLVEKLRQIESVIDVERSHRLNPVVLCVEA